MSVSHVSFVSEETEFKSYESCLGVLNRMMASKGPCEKIVELAKINEEIIRNVDDFWNNLKGMISKTYLNITSDDLLNILIFILIK